MAGAVKLAGGGVSSRPPRCAVTEVPSSRPVATRHVHLIRAPLWNDMLRLLDSAIWLISLTPVHNRRRAFTARPARCKAAPYVTGGEETACRKGILPVASVTSAARAPALRSTRWRPRYGH